eukprot:CAMPEP_0181474950 /NCGR_PEP_ID=MMETSP1110-20121109/40926_1 /TAXON_ID=174948 /ORGANISM="Symbiodinium sp., Strain CCMP421" /LENGTH=93 /DNA_ID=CAMNT_0023600159 /DNA_START=523 /DNA_END=802 /DNA_ORIENTATION=-
MGKLAPFAISAVSGSCELGAQPRSDEVSSGRSSASVWAKLQVPPLQQRPDVTNLHMRVNFNDSTTLSSTSLAGWTKGHTARLGRRQHKLIEIL